MARVANRILPIQQSKILIDNGKINVSGPLGSIGFMLHKDIIVNIDETSKTLSVSGNSDVLRGTFVRLIENAIMGVHKLYEKKIQLVGVGFKFAIEGSRLKMFVGYSHDVFVDIPAGVNVKLTNVTNLVLSSCNKELIGRFANVICSQKKYNVYKGTGIKDFDKYYRLVEAKKK